MKFRCRPSWAMVALGFVAAACGAASEPDRFDLRTPGAQTGAPLAPTPIPTAPAEPKATPTPTPTPKPKRKPVTRTEKRIIRAWADALRGGHVTKAARYFSIPSLVSQDPPAFQALVTLDDVKDFNRSFPCGAKLVSTRRGVDRFVVGVFRLTERPGGAGCGSGTGELAAVAFLIRDGHITQWVRVPDSNITADPTPTPTPTPTATPTSSADPGPPTSA